MTTTAKVIMFIFLKQEIPVCYTMLSGVIHLNFSLKLIQHVPINGFLNSNSIKEKAGNLSLKESLATCALQINHVFKGIQMLNFFFPNAV